MDLQKEIRKLLGLDDKRKHIPPKVRTEQKSKHMGKYFKATKAYADDRQKQPQNRRKNGRRRRK